MTFPIDSPAGGRIAVLISGRGSNMKSLIEACCKNQIRAKVAFVLSNRPEAPGLEVAAAAGIETQVLHHREFPTREEYDLRVVEMLREREIDLVCLAGFMRLISPVLVAAFQNKIMNIHPALLPAFPGLHAQRQAVEYGVKVTGCTVHFVDEGLDSGPIILQRTMEVLPDDTEETLSARLLPLEHATYVEAVQLFFENRLQVDGRNVRIKAPEHDTRRADSVHQERKRGDHQGRRSPGETETGKAAHGKSRL